MWKGDNGPTTSHTFPTSLIHYFLAPCLTENGQQEILVMALRRSKRIAQIEKEKIKPVAAVVTRSIVTRSATAAAAAVSSPIPRISQVPKKSENEVLKEKLKRMQKTLSSTRARLLAEQRSGEMLQLRLAMSENNNQRMMELNEEVKNLVDRTTVLAEKQQSKIGELQLQIQECQDHDKFEEAMNKERQIAKKYRDDYLEECKKYTNNWEERNGPFPWRVCEICAFKFGEEAGRVPRVLGCGHTVCTDCAGNFINQHTNSLRCPFDRQFMQLGINGVHELPKNFVLLNM
ncbi:hypothetical protein B9Z55_002528 [Caenorhabditis nigoni]|nr:hypothetical protein B9Z55_002528 [Caenorhabditis nigoni]